MKSIIMLVEDAKLYEFIDTKHVYRAAKDAILCALKEASRAVAAKYKEGDYWAGEVLDILACALDPIVQEAVSKAGLKRRVIVTTQLIDGEIINSAGGGIVDIGRTAYFRVNVPRRWFSGTPGTFHGILRSSGNGYAEMLARTVAHEVLHMEQAGRSEASLTDHSRASSKARYVVRGAAIGDPDYWTAKDEIEAQAESAALELIAFMGGKKAIDLFLGRNAKRLVDIVKAEWVSPHLTAYWNKVRSHPARGEAWKKFLKALYLRLQHHLTDDVVSEDAEWSYRNTIGKKPKKPFASIPAPESDAFKAWFGKSKIVDSKQRPLPVFHGRKTDFTAFDPAKAHSAWRPNTIFFTTDPDIAASYSGQHTSFTGHRTYKDGANVMPVYLKVLRPLVINAQGDGWSDIAWKGELWDTNTLASYARNKGYDGLIIKNVHDAGEGLTRTATIIVVYSPNQIKSVFNKGTWSSESDHVSEDLGDNK